MAVRLATQPIVASQKVGFEVVPPPTPELLYVVLYVRSCGELTT